MKECSKCKLVKSLDEFYGRSLTDAWCKLCRKEWRSSEKQYKARRKYHLQKKYNMTEDDFHNLLEQQEGKCAICAEILQNPLVDHNYANGHVRGLLCNQCNSGLGMFKDSIGNLIKAIAYLGYNAYGTKFKVSEHHFEKRENANEEYIGVFDGAQS